MATRIELDFRTVSRPALRRPSGQGLITGIRDAAMRWRERRMLETLDDRMLRDIAISRSQALAEACKPFWRH